MPGREITHKVPLFFAFVFEIQRRPFKIENVCMYHDPKPDFGSWSRSWDGPVLDLDLNSDIPLIPASQNCNFKKVEIIGRKSKKEIHVN